MKFFFAFKDMILYCWNQLLTSWSNIGPHWMWMKIIIGFGVINGTNMVFVFVTAINITSQLWLNVIFLLYCKYIDNFPSLNGCTSLASFHPIQSVMIKPIYIVHSNLVLDKREFFDLTVTSMVLEWAFWAKFKSVSTKNLNQFHVNNCGYVNHQMDLRNQLSLLMITTVWTSWCCWNFKRGLV